MRLRPTHATLAFLHDIVMAALSYFVAMYLRLGDEVWGLGENFVVGMVLFVAVAAIIFRALKLYGGIWHYASLNDLLALTKAATLIILVYLPLMFLLTRLESLPRSVTIINWLVLLALLGGPRFLYRRLKDARAIRRGGDVKGRVPVLLIGAGDDAEMFIRAMRRSAHAPYNVVGILSDSAQRVGRNIHGVDVLGQIGDFATAVEQLAQAGRRPQKIILTKTIIDGTIVRHLLNAAAQVNIGLARLPRITDLHDGVTDELAVRPIAVEDLLGRPQAALDREGMQALITGHKVVITGAGGSIGSELVRQVAELGPERLTIVDACEFALYNIDMEARKTWPELDLKSYIGDVRDRGRIDQILGDARPHLVFHAAALKHVPLVEENPVEGILTNVIGSRNVAESCLAHGVTAMVQISTDKAVNPTNVMGATKRLAECYCQALDMAKLGTRFLTVRFGNVLGSTGSVVPLFQRQLKEGGPITVTHQDVTRYFMTIHEAVELVLQATALGTKSQDEGKIYVLDMGEPVRIMDLAEQMIRLAGLRPGKDVKIDIVGLRPGEKLFEEIFHSAEPPEPTAAKGILLASPRMADIAALRQQLVELEACCRRADLAAARSILQSEVPEFQLAQPEAARAASEVC
ncbi:MAG: polysaccharide biosynthesis protein [Rhodospirillaceae bacterium]|nr:polysaccharide biosynthesis protein [Rhodospirillales bacterium]